jgi:hypothetical protein
VKQTYILTHATARARAIEAVRAAPENYVVTINDLRRNSDQNALLWVYLNAFAEQLQWPVNGAMTALSADDWKSILSAAYKRESQRIAQGIDGGMVMLGLRTSKMGKREFADFLDYVASVAADRGVVLDAD